MEPLLGHGKTGASKKEYVHEGNEALPIQNVQSTYGAIETGRERMERTYSLRQGSQDAHQQKGPTCFSFAAATALRNTLTWKNENCRDGRGVEVPEHCDIQEFFNEVLTGNFKNCGQLCFPMDKINSRLLDYGIEMFSINNKEQLLTEIKNGDKGVSVVAFFFATVSQMENFKYFGTKDGLGNETSWSNKKLDYDDFRRGRKIGEPINTEYMPRTSKIYLPPPIFSPLRLEVDEPITAGHAMYISGEGIDKRWRNGDPATRMCNNCMEVLRSKGERGFEEQKRIREEYYTGENMGSKDANEPVQNCQCLISTPFIELKNSWGKDWGDNGFVKYDLNKITNIIPLPDDLNNISSCKLMCSRLSHSISSYGTTRTEDTSWSFLGFRPKNCALLGGFKKARQKTKQRKRKKRKTRRRKTRKHKKKHRKRRRTCKHKKHKRKRKTKCR